MKTSLMATARALIDQEAYGKSSTRQFNGEAACELASLDLRS